ncbi:hypothetical protein NHJ6243_005448 [Beauveria neobassiana]
MGLRGKTNVCTENGARAGETTTEPSTENAIDAPPTWAPSFCLPPLRPTGAAGIMQPEIASQQQQPPIFLHRTAGWIRA